jgi:hypothetical protein
METQSQIHSSFDQCIRDCLECYQECVSCLQHCLSLGGHHSEAKHISRMMECARLCQMASEFMLSNSPLAVEFCQLCAKACDACAESCSRVDPEDKMMQECASICRKCAESCRSMGH